MSPHHIAPSQIPHCGIQQLSSLHLLLGLRDEDLEYYTSHGISNCYWTKSIPKASGIGERHIHVPNKKIKALLRKINHCFFTGIIFPKYLYGSISDLAYPRDYIRCAEVHCNCKLLIKIDIKDFFPSISYDMVKDIFVGLFKFSDPVASFLADFTTVDGCLPQGAPTSTYIANLIFYKEEPKIVSLLEREGLRYTRLIDDITISHKERNKKKEFAFDRVKNMIESKGFTVNDIKSKIENPVSSQALKVHGVCVDMPQPRFNNKVVENIRHDVMILIRRSNLNNKIRMNRDFHKEFYSVCGKLTKLKRVNNKNHFPLFRALKKYALPLPEHKEIARINRIISNLERDYSLHNGTEQYKRRYHHVSFRISVLKRIYKIEALSYRARLRLVRP